MSETRLTDYLEHMRRAAVDARSFVEGVDREVFLQDRRCQNAVVMSLIVIGEAAARIMDRYPDFVTSHPEIPLAAMRSMRNRIAHGYFEINFEVVWDTVARSLPDLLSTLGGLSSER